jgi:hypothetical protein
MTKNCVAVLLLNLDKEKKNHNTKSILPVDSGSILALQIYLFEIYFS